MSCDVVRGSGQFLFFSLTFEQDENYDIFFHANHKLDELETFPLSRVRHKNGASRLNAIEQKSFNSLKSSFGYLGIAASPTCSFDSSYLQQHAPNATVYDLITQSNSLRIPKKI